MPENTVYAGRPGKWGNPFVVGMDGEAARCVELFRMLCAGKMCISKSAGSIDAQRDFLAALNEDLPELVGKDLACWCRLDAPCHVDVLLEVAAGLGADGAQSRQDAGGTGRDKVGRRGRLAARQRQAEGVGR